MLESNCYADNTFLTLTYNEENVPWMSDKTTLAPEDVSLWLKRFRKAINPIKVRYFLVGEYGEDNNRPHYHLALFNYPACLRINPRYTREGKVKPCGSNCVCAVVCRTWDKGRVALDRLEPASAQYIAGYTVKKMTEKDDMRLNGRHPEYARMSLRPGIGYNFMYEVASGLMEHGLEEKMIDVPGELQHGVKKRPIGRYLQKTLRTMVGKDEKTPEEILQQIEEELSVLRETAFNNSRSFAKEIADAGKQKRLKLEAREKIHKQRKKL